MNRILSVVICVFLCGFVLNTAFAQLIDTDIETLSKRAEAGDLGAQTDLGAKYLLGDGVTRDFNKGYELISDAAYQGETNAMNWMGAIVNANEADGAARAVEWYLKAAEKGHGGAQYNLANLYLNRNTLEDDLEAFKWFTQAVEHEGARSQHKLGLMYLEGRGVARNAVLGIEWVTKAAEQDELAAQMDLGLIYRNGIGTGANAAEALKWYAKAAESGNVQACEKAADMYDGGVGTAVDYAAAFKLYSTAAEQGYSPAQYQLARYYWNGLGLKRDKVMAYVWAVMSVENPEQWSHSADSAKALLAEIQKGLSKKELKKGNEILASKGIVLK